MLWYRYYFLLVVASCYCFSRAAPLTDRDTMLYLVDYGYLDPQMMKPDLIISPDQKNTLMKDGITQFQQFFGLKATGEMNKETMKMMQMPRCGVKDKFDFDNAVSRTRRYALWGGKKWTKQELTYRIKRYPMPAQNHRMRRAAVDEVLFSAFSVWQNVTNLLFKNVEKDSADIDIEFQQPDVINMDTTSFERGSLGIAYMPEIGDIVFNDKTNWAIRQEPGFYLLAAAVHEIGHSLGLHHSNVSGSIMKPMLTQGYSPHFTLHDDDILGIQELYGKKIVPSYDLCQDASFDAIFQNPDGSLYVIKGQYFWRVRYDGLMNSFPHHLKHHWEGLPDNIDAALATPSSHTYFFKGDMYWAYKNNILIPGHPKLIKDGWPGIPDDLDAATWHSKSLFYFFKGDKFWVFDSYQRPNVPQGYPKDMSEWGKNIDGELDAVLYLRGGDFYFFKDGLYVRYSNFTGLVDSPRSVKIGWFGCEGVLEDSATSLNFPSYKVSS